MLDAPLFATFCGHIRHFGTLHARDSFLLGYHLVRFHSAPFECTEAGEREAATFRGPFGLVFSPKMMKNVEKL